MKSTAFRTWLFVLLSLIFTPAVSIAAATESEEHELCDRINQIYSSGGLSVRGQAIAAVTLIPELYARRDYSLAWRSEGNMLELIEAIDASRAEGLTPADYHRDTLVQMLRDYSAGRLTACERADFDILLSDALIRLGYHLMFGKVNPRSLDADWNLKRDTGGQDPIDIVLSAMNPGSVEAVLRTLVPNTRIYIRMKQALAEYREIEALGGWPGVPAGPAIKPDMHSDRLLPVRERLRITGDLPDGLSSDPMLYDQELQRAVERFQQRHMLEPDAVIGSRTLEAMNIPVSSRIDQIRVNMERARWVFREVPEEYIVADIAGFQVMYIRNDEVLWESPAQVGQPYRKTPIFQDTMKFIVFNPTWTVPPTILEKDVLPKIRKDPGYLSEKNMHIIDRQGRQVDPATIDWPNTKPANFPYLIRQEPGPGNALGRIKFMFPNKHLVYLHDTPHKSGFKAVERAFSSGCIRIERPFELAELLLDDRENWSLAKIRELVDSEVTRSVNLTKKIPVFLLYWTVDGNEEGFYFKPDVYDRDSDILKALDGEFRFDVPDNMPDWFKTGGNTGARG